MKTIIFLFLLVSSNDMSFLYSIIDGIILSKYGWLKSRRLHWKRPRTFVDSTKLVSMTMCVHSCSHSIRQKSSRVDVFGAGMWT